MKQLIGHKCKLHINSKGHDLFYTAKVLDITDNHIYFLDRFNKQFIFNIKDIKEISSII